MTDLGKLYYSFSADDVRDNFLQEAASSLSFLFQSDTSDISNPNPGPRYTEPPFSSIAEMTTYSKYLLWKGMIDYGGMVRLALASSWIPSPEEHMRKLGYTQFDKDTGFPTHGGTEGAELSKAEMLNGKREFLKQKKLHDVVKVFKPRPWDDTQPSALCLGQRKRLLKLRMKVEGVRRAIDSATNVSVISNPNSNARHCCFLVLAEWDKKRREDEKNAPPPPPPASPSLRPFDKARKYDKDRRNKRASKITMLAMLAAENKLDALLEKMESKEGKADQAKALDAATKEPPHTQIKPPMPPPPSSDPPSKPKRPYGADRKSVV